MHSKLWSLIEQLHAWDVALSERIALKLDESQPRPLGYWIASLVAHLGDSWLWLLIAGFLFKSADQSSADLRQRRRVLIVTWLASAIIATVTTLLVKRQVQRQRPGKRSLFYGSGADVHSFPSGHAARLGVIALWGNLLWPNWGWLTWGLAFGVGWSRVALGIHYAGDVVVGWVLGGTIGLLFRKLKK